MEEIKLPKFKTKEELEQFAMGLMTENESLKKVITLKDDTIKGLDKQLGEFIAVKRESEIRRNEIHDLEIEIKSLKEKDSSFEHRKLYDYKRASEIEKDVKIVKFQIKYGKAERMVFKLCSMVTFMFGLLPRFKAKRVIDAFGEFNVADYRL